MKNAIKFLGIFFVLTLIFTVSASAQTSDTLKSKIDTSNVVYPIKELGSCKDKVDCATFCNVSSNMVACVDYAEKNSLLSGEDLRISKAVAKRVAEGTTPGSCKSEAECQSFCSGKVENIKECVSFADGLKIIPENELAEAKKILKALEGGAQMPGSCKTKGECENYCAVASHIDECLTFAEASDILPKEELEQAKKVASFLKEGKTPGKCENKKSCDEYCSKDANFTECISFAETAGFISKEDAEMAKKAGGVGPGGCKSKDACEEYCNKQENIDVCTNFAIEKGLVSEEDKKMIESGIEEMTKALDSMSPEMRGEVESCLKNSIGEEQYNRILNKIDKPTKDIGGKIQSCFARLTKPQGDNMPASLGKPSEEDIKKMIPGGMPKDVQEKIQEQIKNQIKNGVPPGSDALNNTLKEMKEQNQLKGILPPQGTIPSGMGTPNNNIVPPVEMKDLESVQKPGAVSAPAPSCSDFANMPSAQYCQMVPEGPAQEACIRCKS